jgi:hypothetical protein
MRGAVIILASALGAVAMTAAPESSAAPVTSLDALLREKTAAVTIVRTKARKYTAALANGRLLQAYLTAATGNEGERIKDRIVSSLKALQNRYGLTTFRIMWRDGDVVAEVGPEGTGSAARRPNRTPALKKGLAQETGTVGTLINGDTLTYVAAVERSGQKEIVVSIEQDVTAYERVLMHGLADTLYVVIVDDRGNVVSDSSGTATAGQAATFGGLTIDQLRARLRVSGSGGSGIVTLDGRMVRVGVQTADGWTVVAMDHSPGEDTCIRDDGAPCR